MTDAVVTTSSDAAGRQTLTLAGRWTLRALSGAEGDWRRWLAANESRRDASWNCMGIEALDSTGALLLWRAWGRRLPEVLLIRPEHQRIFERIAAADREPPAVGVPRSPFEGLIVLGGAALAVGRHVRAFVALLGQLVLDCAHLLRHRADLPKREISANIYKSGVRAMPAWCSPISRRCSCGSSAPTSSSSTSSASASSASSARCSSPCWWPAAPARR
jgi:phospholipid/cholesterol/gamma-HCH transport system permease protein